MIYAGLPEFVDLVFQDRLLLQGISISHSGGACTVPAWALALQLYLLDAGCISALLKSGPMSESNVGSLLFLARMRGWSRRSKTTLGMDTGFLVAVIARSPTFRHRFYQTSRADPAGDPQLTDEAGN